LSAKSSSSPAGRALAFAALAVLGLSACGRYGPLEPPEANAQAKATPPKPNEMNAETLSPQVKPKIPPITPPNQPFFLDFLLK
jgi:predicted small lipoprotein YifL